MALIAMGWPVIAGAVTVDDLSTDQGPVAAGSSDFVSGAGILDTERDVIVELTAGAGPATLEVTSSTVAFAVGAASTAEARIEWDGVDGAAALDPSGLANEDLTDGGGSDAFAFVVASATAGVELEITVFTDGDVAEASTFRTTLPAITGARTYRVPFSSFLPVSGALLGADFGDAGAIRFLLRGSDGATATLGSPIATVAGAPEIHATKIDQDDFMDDGGSELGTTDVGPGDTITYKVTVTNTGDTATAVTLSDLLDPNLTQSGAAVRISPIPFPDTYVDHCGNTTLNVDGAAGFEGLLDNDVDPDNSPADNSTLTITEIQGDPIAAGTFTSDQGGTIFNVAAATGQFDYTPPGGFTGADSFSYTVEDDEGQTNVGQAVITISELIWFVDNGHGGANQGTQADPFQSLAEVNGAGGAGDPDEVGHTIFVFENGGGAYTGGIELEDGQLLIGEAAGLAGCLRTPIPAGGRPVIENAGGHGIEAAADNTLRGLELGATATGSAALASVANVGTLTVSDTVISGAGRAIELTGGGTLAAAFNSIASTSSTTDPAVELDGLGGSLTVADGAGVDTSIMSAALGVDVRNSQAGASFDFADTTVVTTGFGVFVGSNGTGTVTFDDLDVTTSIGPGVVGNVSGSMVVTDAASSVSAVGGPALDLSGIDLGAGLTLASASSSGSGGGIRVAGINDPIVINGGSVTKSNSNHAVDIDGGSAAFTYAGTVSQTGSGMSVRVNGRTAGVHTFSGNVSGAMGGGVELTSNTGAQIDFTGGLDLQTGTNIAFLGTGGGTINVTSAGLTQLAVNGANHAVDLNGVAMGASDVTFDSITATNTAFEGIDIDGVTNAGTFAGGTVVVNGTAAGAGIDISGSSAAFTFTSATIDATDSHGINLVGGNGSVSFGSVNIDNMTSSAIRVVSNTSAVMVSGGTIGSTSDTGNASNAAIRVSGGAGAVTVAAAVTNDTVGKTVEVTGRTGGAVTLSGNLDHSVGGAIGVHVRDNGGGSTTLSGGTQAIDTTTANAVELTNNAGHTVSFTNGGLDIDTTFGVGFFASGGGTINSSGAGNSVTADSGRAVDIDGVTTGLTFSSVSSTGAASRGIELTNLAASSSFTVTGTTTVTNAGAGGGGIDGSIHIDTVGASSALAFGTTNINTRNDTGIFIDNAQGTVGFGTLTDANGNNAGGYGVRVENTAAAVTFAAANISNTNQTSATLDANTDGVPDNEGDGDAIFLTNNTGTFNVNGGTLTALATDGIDVRSAGGLNLVGVTIQDIGTGSANPATIPDCGIYARDLRGANLLRNSIIRRAQTDEFDEHIRVLNNGADLDELRLDNTDFSNTTIGSVGDIRGANSVRVENRGAMDATVIIENGSEFTGIRLNAIAIVSGDGNGAGDGTIHVVVDGSTLIGAAPVISGGVIQIGSANDIVIPIQDDYTVHYNVMNTTLNNIRVGATLAGVMSFVSGDVSAGGAGPSITGRLIGNTIDDIRGRRGINVIAEGDDQAYSMTIADNSIQDLRAETISGASFFAREGIAFANRDDTTNRLLRVIGNNLGAGPDGIIQSTGGSLAGDDSPVADGSSREALDLLVEDTSLLTALVHDNVLLVGAGGSEGVEIDVENSTTLNLTFTDNTVAGELDMPLSEELFMIDTEAATASARLDLDNNTAAIPSQFWRFDENTGPITIENRATVEARNTGSFNFVDTISDNGGDVQRPVGIVIARSGSISQTATVSTAYGVLETRVLDDDGDPASGVTVTFTAPGVGASGTFPGGNTCVTNASGICSVGFTANATPGPFRVTAAAAGSEGAFFYLRNLP